jgi:hypothetical protein
VAQIIERKIIMIKKMYLNMALMMIVLLTALSCGNKSIPSGPYDATPTPEPQLRAEIYLYDTMPDNTTNTAANVLIQIVSPNNVITSETTDASGYARITFYGYAEI